MEDAGLYGRDRLICLTQITDIDKRESPFLATLLILAIMHIIFCAKAAKIHVNILCHYNNYVLLQRQTTILDIHYLIKRNNDPF